MKFNLKNYIATGAILATSLLGYSQNKTNSTFIDSVMTESKKYQTMTHFAYKLFEGSEVFQDTSKLEKIIKNVEKQHPKKEKYSREEVIEILKTTDKEIKNSGLRIKNAVNPEFRTNNQKAANEESNKEISPENYLNSMDASFIYLAVGEKLEIPLYGVRAFGHMFIRHDKKRDGHNASDPNDTINRGDFNWETTAAEIIPDKLYTQGVIRGLSKFSENLISSNIYLGNLTKKGLISTFYCSKGNSLFTKEQKNKLALKNYYKAEELAPNDLYLKRMIKNLVKDIEFEKKIKK